jgi:uncharacterized membrane protein
MLRISRTATSRGLWARLTRRGPNGERGAFLVLASVFSIVALGATALAVDLGEEVYTKRHLQEAVDNAALDAVRAVGDKYGQGSGLTPAQYAVQLAQRALKANGFDTANTTVVTAYSVVLGHYDPHTHGFTANGTPNDAVQVAATISRPNRFLPGSNSLTATSVASLPGSPGGCTDPICPPCTGACDHESWGEAGIAVGSYLARVNTSAGLLNSILGGFVHGNVTLVGYTGLAAGSVTLGELRTEFAAGTVDGLLTSSITYKNLLLMTASALQKQNTAASLSARTDVLSLAAVTDTTLPALPPLTLGSFIKIDPGAESSAAGAVLNVGQLVSMAAEVANGQNAVSATLSAASLGGLGSLLNAGGNTLSLKVIEPPQIAYGAARQSGSPLQWETRAKTAQIRAQLHLRPLSTVSVLGVPSILDLPVYLEAASAQASLTGITCATPKDNSTVKIHTDSQAVNAYVGTVADLSNPVVTDATILNVIGVVKVTGSAHVTLASAASSPDLSFHPGPFDPSVTQSVGGTSLGLGVLLKNKPVTLTPITLGVPLVLLGGLVGSVTAVVNPILAALDAGLSDPVFASLGVSLGGGDSWTWALDCTSRAVVK